MESSDTLKRHEGGWGPISGTTPRDSVHRHQSTEEMKPKMSRPVVITSARVTSKKRPGSYKMYHCYGIFL